MWVAKPSINPQSRMYGWKAMMRQTTNNDKEKAEILKKFCFGVYSQWRALNDKIIPTGTESRVLNIKIDAESIKKKLLKLNIFKAQGLTYFIKGSTKTCKKYKPLVIISRPAYKWGSCPMTGNQQMSLPYTRRAVDR